MSTDRIEKKILLKAPRARVWRAISDSREYGRWFGMKLNGPFVAGQKITGTIAMTEADPEVAKLQEPHVGKAAELWIDRIQPETLFSMKWHPFAIDPNVDYSEEPMTLIEFALQDDDGGTWLTITESGFENIPASRRAEAMKANESGWEHQCQLIKKYLQKAG